MQVVRQCQTGRGVRSEASGINDTATVVVWDGSNCGEGEEGEECEGREALRIYE